MDFFCSLMLTPHGAFRTGCKISDSSIFKIGRGLFGARDVHKKILDVLFPKFNEKNKVHLKIAALSEKAHQKAKAYLTTNSPQQQLSAIHLGRYRMEIKRHLKGELGRLMGWLGRWWGAGFGKAIQDWYSILNSSRKELLSFRYKHRFIVHKNCFKIFELCFFIFSSKIFLNKSPFFSNLLIIVLIVNAEG